ncbi:T9SS type A sorting domain-containing protein [Gelidibacter gilvus]|uniref:T9SS type A sorting domain-containing protein n=1 Tax=Gelidibacter gilvus TaxID=59602 RepID=A0A4Q0XGY0_9FLAO|nr:T9SS type A sorting domain-containing protein [Gelidibacter gilvus]RXJ46016.1 T9SS type A sorting domain-containing protein [Gelidibacter gilvus]
MAKNYKRWMLLTILLITFNISYSQPHHTITFTGNPNDFNAVEKITGGDNVDYYVTFDETTMYFGAFRTNGENFDAYDHFTLYLDTDPTPDLKGKGSPTGFPRDGRIPTLPYRADHSIAIRNNVGGQSFHHRNNGTKWTDQTSGNLSSFIQYTSSTALEIAIPKSKIDHAKGIYFSIFMSNNSGFFGYGDVGYPITFNGNTSSGYFGGIGINTNTVIPTQHTNTPILHTFNNENAFEELFAGGKYAHIVIDDEYQRTVTGDIELVAGGTAYIGPASALTVDGTFTNNGLVTLVSNSTKFPSLIPTSVNGIGTIHYSRYVNGNSPIGRNDLISAPLAGQTFGAFAAANSNLLSNPINNAQKAFAPFNKTTGKYENYDTINNANTILTSASGYRASSTGIGGLFTFTGTVNTNAVSIPILNTSNEFAQWNLIGNPYSSYINTRQFLSNNLNEIDDNGIGIYGYAGGSPDIWDVVNLSNSNHLIAPGQGFYVLSKITGGTITFDPTLREPGESDDFIPNRSTAEEDEASIRIRIASGSKSYHTDIYFNIYGTLDHDPGYDSKLIGNPTFSIYSKLVEDKDNRNLQLLLQTLPYSILDSEVIVPIGIKANQGEQLTISGIYTPYPLPLPREVDVYFEDNITNTSILLTTGDYVFTPDTNLSGSKRFSLRFTNSTLNLESSHFDNLQIYNPYNSGHIIVKGQVSENSRLEVYDLNGRLLQTAVFSNNETTNRFDVSGLSSGIYIVKINNTTGSKIKKIQINQ